MRECAGECSPAEKWRARQRKAGKAIETLKALQQHPTPALGPHMAREPRGLERECFAFEDVPGANDHELKRTCA